MEINLLVALLLSLAYVCARKGHARRSTRRMLGVAVAFQLVTATLLGLAS